MNLDYYDRKFRRAYGIYKICYWCLIGMFAVILGMLLTGCKTQYVTVPEYHEKIVYKTDSFMQRDSIYTHDSIMVYTKGDTIFRDRWKTIYKDRIVERLKVDSFIQRDSVRVPYPVEKQLNKWQQFKVDWCGYIIAAFFIVFIILVYLCIRRLNGLFSLRR